MLPLAEITDQTEFLVEWTGEDEANGSGIANYDVYYRIDDDDLFVDDSYVLWLDNTAETSAVFAAERGHTYSFYSVAWDNVGHFEDAPATADTTIFVQSMPPADLTGNGFVDFEDLTVLLSNWNENVSAAEGNLVDPDGTPVNFEDLTVLLAAWTGPGPAASPQAPGAHVTTGPPISTKQNTESKPVHTATNAHFDRLGKRDDVALRRTKRRSATNISRANPLRRLQAAAVDQAIAEQSTPDRTRILRRRAGSGARR